MSCALDACRQGRENCPSPMYCSGAVEMSDEAIREIRLSVAIRAPITRESEPDPMTSESVLDRFRSALPYAAVAAFCLIAIACALVVAR